MCEPKITLRSEGMLSWAAVTVPASLEYGCEEGAGRRRRSNIREKRWLRVGWCWGEAKALEGGRRGGQKERGGNGEGEGGREGWRSKSLFQKGWNADLRLHGAVEELYDPLHILHQ